MMLHRQLPHKFFKMVLEANEELGQFIEDDYYVSFEANMSQNNMSCLNCYLRRIISTLLSSDFEITEDPRRHVVDGITEAEWLRNIYWHVLPVLISDWYPKVKSHRS